MTKAASIEVFKDLLEEEEWSAFTRTMADAAAALEGRRIWNINSTAHGGGVAEMLEWQMPYELGAGMDVRWLVIDAQPSFFEFTKRLHTLLHGVASNGSSISPQEKRLYEDTMSRNMEALSRQVRPGDVAIVHDPQPAGLVPGLVAAGVHAVWRSHIGVDEPNAITRTAWQFLMPSVAAADASVFSRPTYVWDGLDRHKVAIIPPAIDAFTPKNQDLAPAACLSILQATGVIDGLPGAEPRYHTRAGSPRRVERTTAMTPATPLPANAPLVVQVSRWDRLKDPVGVINGYARYVAPATGAYLVLAGPGAKAVSDDPEEEEVLREVEESCRSLPAAISQRIRIARLPMEDGDENAAIVNALQRHASVVVQKSLREGFGLTVSEAMWKARPVVAGRVGGICDQIEDGRSGVLVDPEDLEAFGGAVERVLRDSSYAEQLGAAARTRVRREFLAPRLLMQEARLLTSLVA